jgi:hypothetical protein
VRLPIRIFALGVAFLLAGCGPGRAPSDASIITRFAAHRAEFGQLLEMFRHDGIDGRLGCESQPQPPDDSTRGMQSISVQRRAEYAKIFETIGCDGAVYYYPGNGRAMFSLWSVGMLFAGQGKNIMFIPGEAPTPLVAETDNYVWTKYDHDQGSVTLYRHIDGPWYLEFDAN